MQNETPHNASQDENNPKRTRNRNSRRATASGTQKLPRSSAKTARPEKNTPSTENASASDLALFSLIADPKTIAGESSSAAPATTSDADQELDRLRQALHAREQELATMRSRAALEDREAHPSAIDADETAAPSTTAEDSSTALSPTSDGLLDATRAHRMAKEARQSERASRLALHAAQQAQKAEVGAEWPNPSAQLQGLDQSSALAGHEQSWETRPLSVQKHLLETASAQAEFNTPSVDPQNAPGTLDSRKTAPSRSARSENSDVQLRAARAEARELEATLSLARDTALNQKLEIARLRSELKSAPENAATEMAALEEAFREVLPEVESIDAEAIRVEAQNEIRLEMGREYAAAGEEIERLKERVALGERESEAREKERRILRETLAAREAELETARVEVEQLTHRLEEEGKLAHELQASLEEERDQNANTERLLSQLRNTLQRVPGSGAEEDTSPQRSEAAVPIVPVRRSTLDIDSDPVKADPVLPTPPNRSDTQVAIAPLTEPTKQGAPAASGKLFDAWQDGQVRRFFGPFGIDTARDLVIAPLARRNLSLDHPGKVLLLGHNSAAWTERLAEDLISHESPPFQILQASGEASRSQSSLQDRPIDEFIAATRQPVSPEDFEALIAETRPSVIVSRNFLSGMSDVAPWLDVLRELPRLGPSLIFLESTGVGPITPTDTMIELGDRIWSLMPARYKREGAQTGAAIESWQEAFLKMQPVPNNGLRAALREGFDLEISAQFGFLSEPFLRSPIEQNFNPEAQRDRRFLHQIADLDDRKIEAGDAPALHFVARVDGRIEE